MKHLLLNTIFSLMIISLMTIASCKNDDEPEPETLPPTLNFTGGNSANSERGKTVTITLQITAQGGIASLTANGAPIAGVTIGATTQTINFDYTVANNVPIGAIPIAFVLTDEKSRTANAQFTITVIGSTVNLSSLATQGIITANVTLDAANNYILDGRLSVANGGILNIPAGTTIKAKTTGLPDSISKVSLVIEQTGKINAVGTSTSPIVFTSESATPQPGDWTGIRINGGGSEGQGTMRYVRIEYAGKTGPAELDKEAGLRLQGVRPPTSISFIQIFKSADEGIKYRSGTTIHLSNIVATDCIGRGIHFRDAASIGTAQFVIIQHRNVLTIPTDDASINNGFPIDMRQSASATIANVTLLGPGKSAEGEVSALRMWSNVGTGKIFNTLVAEYSGYGVRIDKNSDGVVDANGNALMDANPILAFSFIFNINEEPTRGSSTPTLFETNAGFGNTINKDNTPAAASGISVDSYVPTAAIASTNNPQTLGGNFVSAPFVGAIGATDWTRGWVRNANGSIRQ